jgi:hypothetical protein
MTTKEAYEKYKHMDKAFSDYSIMPEFLGMVIVDLWSAVKDSVMKEG